MINLDIVRSSVATTISENATKIFRVWDGSKYIDREELESDQLIILINDIIQKDNPSEIWLIGSAARGERKPQSDIDLLLIDSNMVVEDCITTKLETSRTKVQITKTFRSMRTYLFHENLINQAICIYKKT